MSAPRLIAAVVLALITRASVVAATTYAPPSPFLSGTQPTLGPDATLYLFVPSVTEPELLPKITATQGGTERVVEIEEVGRVPDGSVKRVRIHGLTPGEVSFAFRTGSTEEWKVIDRAPARAWPHVRGLEHHVTSDDGCGSIFVELHGDRAAAFRLRWTEAGKPREAYLPASSVVDVDAIPIRGVQRVKLGRIGCKVNWLGVGLTPLVSDDELLLEGAELTMLGVDGDEVVVMGGRISLRRDRSSLAAFALRPPPPPPPQLVAAPPPVAGTKVVWWRVAAATGGGLTLGAAGVFLAIGRRRRAT